MPISRKAHRGLKLPQLQFDAPAHSLIRLLECAAGGRRASVISEKL